MESLPNPETLLPTNDLVAVWMRKPITQPEVDRAASALDTIRSRSLELQAWLDGNGPNPSDDSIGTLP